MKYIGAHVSASGKVENYIARAQAIGSNTFTLSTKNHHGGPLSVSEAQSAGRLQ